MTQSTRNKILVVEDEASMRKALVDKLRLEGFEVLSANDGKEGLDKAFKETPDLILLDILMPIMNGLTMLQKLRQAGEYGKKVPVILLTNLSADDENVIKKVAETEPAYYIVKASLTLEEVVQKIKERLANN